MTLPRTPKTSFHAVQRIAEFFGGTKAAAPILGVKYRRLHDWTYQETASCPSFAQAIALDIAYRAAGGEGAPLFEAYASHLDLSFNELTACHAALAADLAEASREFGDAWAAATALIVPGHSPNAVQHALIELDQAETLFVRLRRRISSFVRPGTVPGLPGGAQ
ncbi:hypothetical protein [uncultured Sphingomonas sp.]|uniref:hypothetical protein n=1 Tax=uncultured Sphingomonas sp. TaxID=158754 RepID=UPI0025EC8A83|nr:hypothetical protein [uncultured Sphingomonas sp.]